jgi:multicomponent Na+:H+ antiporter subunit E
MNHLRLIAAFLFIYLALTSNLEFSNVAAGFLIAVGLVLLIRPPHRRLNWRRAPSMIFALAIYVTVLVYDLIASGIQIARIVLDPALPIKPGIIAIASQCESELATALSAHAITLTPGEMVIEIDKSGVMYTHCLDVGNAEKYVAQAQKMRRDLLKKIFD